MKLAVANVQRFEDEHFIEWFSYYLIQGVDKFILRTHSMPGDEPSKAREWILKLKEFYDIDHKDITGYGLYEEFQSIMDGPRNDCDWMIWADCDEYYFPIQKDNIKELLFDYEDKPISALGVYWLFFGSSGHIYEPELITKGFDQRSSFNYVSNHSMKSIVKGNRAGKILVTNPHVYTTEYGTYDLEGRLIPNYCGLNHESYNMGCPSIITHNVMRINHYYCHSYDWFQRIKTKRGPGERPPEAPGGTITEEAFFIHDKNHIVDDSMWVKYGDRILETIRIVKAQLEIL